MRRTGSALNFVKVSKDVWECVDRGNTFTIWLRDDGKYVLTKRGDVNQLVFFSTHPTPASARNEAEARRFEYKRGRDAFC